MGKLYRAVESLNLPDLPDLVVELDIELVVEGFEVFTTKAQELYEEYAQDLLGIMRLFGIKSEVKSAS